MDHQAPWVAEASFVEPVQDLVPRRPLPSARRGHARRALACGIVGVVFLGFVFGPLALRLGQSLRLAMIADDDRASASTVHAALVLGRVGFAIHLALAMAALPWLLFVIPLLQAG